MAPKTAENFRVLCTGKAYARYQLLFHENQCLFYSLFQLSISYQAAEHIVGSVMMTISSYSYIINFTEICIFE